MAGVVLGEVLTNLPALLCSASLPPQTRVAIAIMLWGLRINARGVRSDACRCRILENQFAGGKP